MNWNEAVVLVTGGTGSFGKELTRVLLTEHQPKKLIIFSRDELKQYEMRQTFGDNHPNVRYFIGDVRDRQRLYRAFDGVDVVIHAAALKQVPTAEYNPLEAIQTNVMGAANVIDAAIDRNVRSVIALSTDKAASPVNLYGATKLCAEKLFVAGNHYAGTHATRFSVVRYGNVMGSRGSVVPLFLKLRGTGRLPITDERMTRFWITLRQAVNFVLSCLDRMEGGEIFVPKIPSMRIVDLARAIGEGCELDVVGIRPGEKLHEFLITEDDARNCLEFADSYVILPEQRGWALRPGRERPSGTPCAESFRYSSDANSHWLSVAELRDIVRLTEGAPGEAELKRAA
jgi:UDP-N-acetylglucosamine 4,6-dehydratase